MQEVFTDSQGMSKGLSVRFCVVLGTGNILVLRERQRNILCFSDDVMPKEPVPLALRSSVAGASSHSGNTHS